MTYITYCPKFLKGCPGNNCPMCGGRLSIFRMNIVLPIWECGSCRFPNEELDEDCSCVIQTYPRIDIYCHDCLNPRCRECGILLEEHKFMPVINRICVKCIFTEGRNITYKILPKHSFFYRII